ncbi:MAG: hypothetical protein MJ180_04290 [Candidatus Gastranaerophilales bacterium]|nr:hypothetical protein [Candidatus Gastranaerophilales bacterium]
MKKFFVITSIICISALLKGEGYKGTLPDLSVKRDYMIEKDLPKNLDVLPLDKLTIPIKRPVKIDSILDEYLDDITNAENQLERLAEILKGDKSFKNFIAAANVLNLTTQNILDKYKEDRFNQANKCLDDINHDVQVIKDYWVKVNKTAPYASVYETEGAYTGAVLNNQLNKFIKVLEYANRDLKSKVPQKEL